MPFRDESLNVSYRYTVNVRAKLVVGDVTWWQAGRSDVSIRYVTSRTREYVVAGNCSRNHFISEKYKTVQSITLIFFKIVPLCNYTLLAATVNVLESILATIFWKPSQLFRRILNDAIGIAKVPPPPLHCWFQSREQVKISWSRFRRVLGMPQCFHILIIDQERPVCWSMPLGWKVCLWAPTVSPTVRRTLEFMVWEWP